tara:strand:- start:44 stop:790 length:747 start_codon:yes stop_codon:yes gene_type:complete
MSEKLLITIITCTYNSETTIADCISSVKNQTYSNIEHLIIDGLSNDSTLKIIKSINPNCKIISEKDEGIYDAFNKGVLSASGDIIGFLHSDDLFHDSDCVKKIISHFNNKYDGVYGNLNYISKLDQAKIIRKWRSRKYSHSLLSRGWMPAHPTLFLKNEVYKKHGGFNPEYKISADYDFMVRILNDRMLNFSFIPLVITKMRLGGNSNRSLLNLLRKMKEDYRIIKANKIGGFFTLLEKNFSKINQFF